MSAEISGFLYQAIYKSQNALTIFAEWVRLVERNLQFQREFRVRVLDRPLVSHFRLIFPLYQNQSTDFTAKIN